MKLSSEEFLASFKAKRSQGKMKPSASHFSCIAMFQLADYIQEVGAFMLKTLASASSQLHVHVAVPPSELSAGAVWWWTLKQRAFEAVVPQKAFGPNVQQWCIVSHVFPHT